MSMSSLIIAMATQVISITFLDMVMTTLLMAITVVMIAILEYVSNVDEHSGHNVDEHLDMTIADESLDIIENCASNRFA